MQQVLQGQIYWADLGEPVGLALALRRPVVVVQSDRFNRSTIATVVVCACTTNLRLAQAPGNVLLKPLPGALTMPTVVNVSALATIDRSQLLELIGKLEKTQLLDVLEGISLVLRP